MAKKENLNRLLKERFTDFNGAPDLNAFIDYMQVCIYNDGDLMKNINACNVRYISGNVWNAILTEINDLFYYLDIASTPANSTQLKQALTVFFDTDYKNVTRPIIDYFIQERATD